MQISLTKFARVVRPELMASPKFVERLLLNEFGQ